MGRLLAIITLSFFLSLPLQWRLITQSQRVVMREKLYCLIVFLSVTPNKMFE